MITDARQTLQQRDGSQGGAVGECVIANGRHRGIEGNPAYTVLVSVGGDGGAEAVGIGKVEQFAVRGGIEDGIDPDEGSIGVEVRFPAEPGTRDGDGLVGVLEDSHGAIPGREGDGKASGKGHGEGDDVIVDVLGEGATVSRDQGDFLEAVDDGRLRDALLERDVDVAGEVLVVVALEGDGGDVAAGQAELDAAADIDELQLVRGGMGQGDEQVVVEGARDAALGGRQAGRHGRSVADRVLVIGIQAPDVVRRDSVVKFVLRAENGGRRGRRVLGDVTDTARSEKDIDRIGRSPGDRADAVFIDRNRGPGRQAGLRLGEDFGKAGHFIDRRRLLGIFLAGTQDKGEGKRQAGKHSRFHSAGPLKQLIFIGGFDILLHEEGVRDQEGKIAPEVGHPGPGGAIRVARRRFFVRKVHKSNVHSPYKGRK